MSTTPPATVNRNSRLPVVRSHASTSSPPGVGIVIAAVSPARSTLSIPPSAGPPTTTSDGSPTLRGGWPPRVRTWRGPRVSHTVIDAPAVLDTTRSPSPRNAALVVIYATAGTLTTSAPPATPMFQIRAVVTRPSPVSSCVASGDTATPTTPDRISCAVRRHSSRAPPSTNVYTRAVPSRLAVAMRTEWGPQSTSATLLSWPIAARRRPVSGSQICTVGPAATAIDAPSGLHSTSLAPPPAGGNGRSRLSAPEARSTTLVEAPLYVVTAILVPSGLSAVSEGTAGTSISRTTEPVPVSATRTTPSSVHAAANRPPSALNDGPQTEPSPSTAWTRSPVSGSQRRAAPSSPVVTRYSPSPL